MEGTRFRLFPQPRFLDDFEEPETVYVSSPAGSLEPGPADERMYTIFPVGKPSPYGINPNPGEASDVLMPPWKGEVHPLAEPDEDGHFDYLEPGTPQFEAAHLFGTVRFVMDIWEGYFDRPIPWHSARHYERLELTILPTLENAYSGYGFLEMGGDRKHGRYKPFSLNFDVIAHEVGHAFIYSEIGVPDPNGATGEYYGFHESAADLVALVSSLHFNSLVDRLLNNTSGNLYRLNTITRMAELSDNSQIRIAANDVRLSEFERGWIKEHKLSQPLTGAFFDIFVDLFHECLLDYGAIDAQMEDMSDQLLATPDYAPVMQALFDEAFARDPDSFKMALIDARDILGTYLADTWQRLDRNDLNFVDVARAFQSVDEDHTGGRYRALIKGNFDMRDIGHVRVGPQLQPLQKDSHANSVRTMMPID
ncbi:hypothetical protein [Hoeflea prorocentri]|uniref:Uncharacterized protein n=1 Tax=Hoeflea prorocentri TaxID=1922333 RepID=A0A9X3ULZ2_9HYPH|nr:hypothetical protein [Hoeflea prorocentri]MCY6382850.1 hypothetical protein [Hoeflea prorocentri]MDA5400650.1 hypothetical protein [Hoeflea prorocentri]